MMGEGIWLDEQGKEAAQQLLENFWIIRAAEPDLYKQIKDREKMLRKFFEEKFGFQLVLHRFFVRLVKLPGEAEPWMGIEDFASPLDYVLLCCLLAFLEEKGAEEQFLLSDITEALQILHPEPARVDWTQYDMRKSLVRVLQFARKMVIIQALDGEESSFSQFMDTEVLYESTPQARYFLRVFHRDLGNYQNPEDLLGNEWLGDDENRGHLRRHRIYRKLFLSPCVYPMDENDPDFLYMKNYRNTIQNDIEETLPATLELYQDVALLVFYEKRQLYTLFPDQRGIADMVLQLARIVRGQIAEEILRPDYLGKIQLTQVELQNLVNQCSENFRQGWTKKHRELSLRALTEELIEILQDWKMLQPSQEPGLFDLMPLLARSIGAYPDDFNKDGDINASA
jgi:uncharacterized protein (TIGR02678 family)